MRKLVIFGTGCHAAVVRACIDPACFRAIGYIDDLAEKGTKIDGLPVLGGVADLPAILAEHPLLAGVIGIGANHVRRMIAQKAERLCPSLKWARSEEHTSELQSLMRISYAVFCLNKKKRLTIREQRNATTTSVTQYITSSTTTQKN